MIDPYDWKGMWKLVEEKGVKVGLGMRGVGGRERTGIEVEGRWRRKEGKKRFDFLAQPLPNSLPINRNHALNPFILMDADIRASSRGGLRFFYLKM